MVQIGTPGQPVRLLPGTSASAGSTIWAVRSTKLSLLITLSHLLISSQVIPEGCSAANPNLTSCPDDRGYLFHSNESTTWSTEGLGNGRKGVLYSLIAVVENMLGLSGGAYYGYDTVHLGLPGSNLPVLNHQLIAGFATNDFWLGSLGLSPLPFNFSDFNDPLPSFLTSLREKELIPSLSWAYTAGAYYKNAPAFGSLTLGGYDTTRSQSGSSNLTVPFGADISKDLLISLDAITYDTAGSTPLSTESISVFIDSLVTDLWLPLSVCRAFEQQFGLRWNSDLESYLLDNITHQALLAQNPQFTFCLSAPGNPNQTIDIVIPYAAFDLEMRPPLVETATRYFPLKRAMNETQYVLGRAFLQETYVVADYDRRQLRLSQAAFPSSEESKIVSIYPPGYQGREGGGGEHEGTRDSHSGFIAGVVLGVVGLLSAVAFVVWIIRRRRLRRVSVGQFPSHAQAAGKSQEEDSKDPWTAQLADENARQNHSDLNELDSHPYWNPGPRREVKVKRISELDGTMYRRELESPEPVAAELDGNTKR